MTKTVINLCLPVTLLVIECLNVSMKRSCRIFVKPNVAIAVCNTKLLHDLMFCMILLIIQQTEPVQIPDRFLTV